MNGSTLSRSRTIPVIKYQLEIDCNDEELKSSQGSFLFIVTFYGTLEGTLETHKNKLFRREPSTEQRSDRDGTLAKKTSSHSNRLFSGKEHRQVRRTRSTILGKQTGSSGSTPLQTSSHHSWAMTMDFNEMFKVPVHGTRETPNRTFIFKLKNGRVNTLRPFHPTGNEISEMICFASCGVSANLSKDSCYIQEKLYSNVNIFTRTRTL